MCIPFFHKWTKWSKPIEEKWAGRPNITPTIEFDFVRDYQEKSCIRCNKYKKRYIAVK